MRSRLRRSAALQPVKHVVLQLTIPNTTAIEVNNTMMNISLAELESNLCHFTGTSKYYRLLPTFLVTDGVKYLMDQAGCYWLTQLYGSHLLNIDFNVHPFTVLKLVRKSHGAEVAIEDGNGNVLARQYLDYTDFPLNEFTLYACWSEAYWVCMLPSEY
jgi:hypothetical protein